MRKAILLVALFAVMATGCATAPAPGPVHPGKVGSGSINAKYSESVALTSGNVWSLARYIGSVDTVGIDLYALSGSASCTVAVQVSNRYDPATSAPSDDTLWDTYSSPSYVSPANLTGAVSNYLIELNLVSPQYERLKFVCSSGTTTLTVTTQLKGS